MKRVLVAPLDWGLGHASRCIPVIRLLLDKGTEVRLAGSGSALALLRAEFPQLKAYTLPAYDPRYPRKGSMVFAMARQLPHFITTIRQEHRVLETLVREHNIELVISDNRYGCWSNAVPCIFITHQSNILMPQRFGWLASLVRWANLRMMRRFTRCWIPDAPGESSLAGSLITFGGGHQGIAVEHIGAVSRFVPAGKVVEKKYDVVAVCSGPEPQRSVLERLLLKELKGSGLRFVIVRGVLEGQRGSGDERQGRGEGQHNDEGEKNGKVIDFLGASELQEYLEQAEIVIARSGYSTVMDMAALGRKAIFIPTPGQTEQEYLAARLKEQGVAFSMPQHVFSLAAALSASEHYSGFAGGGMHHALLQQALDKALQL
jgi:uncharacterized protein (TIGR00661 family)